MLASVKWLRALCPFTEDADRVARALTARGLTVDAVNAFGDDTVLEIDVPANRPDCLGHRGIAREISAALGVPLAAVTPEPDAAGDPVDTVARVAIEAPDLCPRYTARAVRGVRVGPSPPWVAQRLTACGLRSINNVVDASNLVLLELGHPVHFFDLALIDGAALVVRRAGNHERLTTLDGIERRLDPEMLVIADSRRAVALAGVIGGAHTEIGESTRDVLVEAAHFDPGSIRSTARRLGLRTDSSHRFERGVDPQGVLAAQNLALDLLAGLAGGTAAPGILDVHPAPWSEPVLTLRPERVEHLVGFRPAPEEVVSSLRALELNVSESDDGNLEVRVPSWRVDLTREVDLIEEVARHLGYERIPSAPTGALTTAPPAAGRADGAMEQRAADALARLGFHEAYNYAMIASGEDEPFVDPGVAPQLSLSDPISEIQSHLRRSLAPGLLRSADLNLRRGNPDVRLFEIGRVFFPRGHGEFPDERLRLGVVWCGAAQPAHWSAPPSEVELHDASGVLEAVIAALRPTAAPVRRPGAPSGLHPGRSLTWVLASGDAIGWCGALSPAFRATNDLPRSLFLAEIDLDRLSEVADGVATYSRLPRHPAVSRDLSLVLSESLRFEELLRTIDGVPAPTPITVSVVDRYQGKPLEAGQVSLTVRLTLQPADRTLTDEETESYRTRVVEALVAGHKVALRV